MIIAVKMIYIIRFSNEITGNKVFKNGLPLKSGLIKNNNTVTINIAKSPEVEANEIYPKDKNTAINTNSPIIPIPGVKNKTTPIEVAIALPPPNFR